VGAMRCGQKIRCVELVRTCGTVRGELLAEDMSGIIQECKDDTALY
jgi:hypothetical protein